MNNLPPTLFNSSVTSVNVSFHERIHCQLYKRPQDQCLEAHTPRCNVKEFEEKGLAKLSSFSSYTCTFARCKNKATGESVVCMVSSGQENATCWGLIGQNTGVKLTLWTFGLLAVTSNLLVLITLLCNSQARRSPPCIFVMNLLLGNMLIGAHIVIVTVADTVTYGNSTECSTEPWEGKWCVPVFVVKHLGLILVMLSLGLLAVERILTILFRGPHHIDTCRAVGYVIESWLFAAIATIVLWTKAGTWGYLCSTYANGDSFGDIDRGVKCSLVGVCVVLICFYVCLLCRQKTKDFVMSNPMTSSNEYRTTVRMFLLLLSTFFSWALPYIVLLLTVPDAVSEISAMQTIAISLSLNACLHTFIYSFDNDDLENLYGALSCRSEGCMLPLEVQDQCYKDEKKNRGSDFEMNSLQKKKSFESLSLIEIKSSGGSEASARVVTASKSRKTDTPRRGSEVSKSQGAVIITNKSPTASRHVEETTVLLHSVPSSPSTSTKEARTHNEHVSECGTISSDTNVTWLSSSDCHSSSSHSPHAHSKIGDGQSTISSKASSVHTMRSSTERHSGKCTSVKCNKNELDKRREFSDGDLSAKAHGKTSVENSEGEIIEEKFIRDENQNTKRDRRLSPMSPVRDIIARVLTPKMKKRPKTLEAIPNIDPVDGCPKKKRSKSMLEGKDARAFKVKEDVLDALPPVCLRDKRNGEYPQERRNGVLVFRAGEDGLEIHEAGQSTPPNKTNAQKNRESEGKANGPSDVREKTHRDWERLATFLVIRPLSPSSKIKVNTKNKKQPKSNSSSSDYRRNRVQIYANPGASLTSIRSEEEANPEINDKNRPDSPSKKLVKLEEDDTLSALPHHLKNKRPNSTISTSSSARLSKGSLDWDPTFTGDSYMDDEVMPPPPPPPPKAAVELPPSVPPSPTLGTKLDEHVESVQVRLDPNNRYSLEWDPTGVQMRLSVVSHDSKVTDSGDTEYPEIVV